MLKHIVRFMRDEDGASAAEYALLLALIALGMLGATQLLGTNIGNAINAAAQVIQPVAS